jgi:hypothetical protein
MASDHKNSAPPITQSESALKRAADLSRYPMAAAAAAQKPQPAKNAVHDGKALLAATKNVPPPWTCKLCLKLSFFFDGTGNNMESDLSAMEHSNVVRLYIAHPFDDAKAGIYRFYIPGLGTYFKEIGDSGGKPGLGFALGGQARLDWALKQFDIKVAERQSDIRLIKVSVFGFSRGAASARAFCRELAKRCVPGTDPAGTGFKLKQEDLPIEINFLGIFDTVASVGVPMSANNASRILKQPLAKAVDKTLRALKSLEKNKEPEDPKRHELFHLAFGDGGIDPAWGMADGHSAWAKDLSVPPLVKRCVHMLASHEVRNSFPADSTANGGQYPPNVEEMVYPGAHSDIGGGYRPQEQARAPHYGEMLSLIPLHVMYDRARQAGVPLVRLAALSSEDKKSFAIDDEGARHFNILNAHFTHYMNTVGWGGANLGKDMLGHLRMYYRWRFLSIRRSRIVHDVGMRTAEEETLQRNEQQFAEERRLLDQSIRERQQDLFVALENQRVANLRLLEGTLGTTKFGPPVSPQLEIQAQAAAARVNLARDALDREKDKRRTAADDSKIGKAAQAYDLDLMKDAANIHKWAGANPSLRLRPHYRALLDAYREVFADRSNEPLDATIVAFFERYVHDSLAGFDTDQTRRSDPRVVYIGGDSKLLSAREQLDEVRTA